MKKWIDPGMLLVLLWTAFGGSAFAQQTTIGTSEIVIHVKNLQSAERDALRQELTAGAIELVYACVPAGIMVFRSADSGSSNEALRTHVLSMVADRTSVSRVRELPLNLAQAEERCAIQRGQ